MWTQTSTLSHFFRYFRWTGTRSSQRVLFCRDWSKLFEGLKNCAICAGPNFIELLSEQKWVGGNHLNIINFLECWLATYFCSARYSCAYSSFLCYWLSEIMFCFEVSLCESTREKQTEGCQWQTSGCYSLVWERAVWVSNMIFLILSKVDDV